jgi:hypothetical protein
MSSEKAVLRRFAMLRKASVYADFLDFDDSIVGYLFTTFCVFVVKEL